MKVEWRTCFRIGLSAFILYLAVFYWQGVASLVTGLLGAASPLLVGCVMAYLLNILMSFYERHYFAASGNGVVLKGRRPVCMVAAFATLAAIAGLVVVLVVPQLVSCVQLVVAMLPGALEQAALELENVDLLPADAASTLASVDWQSKVGDIFRLLTSGFGNAMDVAKSALSAVFSGIVTAVLGIIFAIYMLLAKERLARQGNRLMARYLKRRWYDKATYLLSVVDDCFHRYIVGQCTEAVILGVLCTVGMLVLRLPYAAMVGALIGFTALIPIAGAYIGAGVGAFMILMVSPVQALVFLVFIVVLQQVEGNLIYPRVVGSSIGLPALWVLAAVTVGGGVAGISGMFLGVPLAAVLYRLLREDVNRGLSKGGGASVPQGLSEDATQLAAAPAGEPADGA